MASERWKVFITTTFYCFLPFLIRLCIHVKYDTYLITLYVIKWLLSFIFIPSQPQTRPEPVPGGHTCRCLRHTCVFYVFFQFCSLTHFTHSPTTYPCITPVWRPKFSEPIISGSHGFITDFTSFNRRHSIPRHVRTDNCCSSTPLPPDTFVKRTWKWR